MKRITQLLSTLVLLALLISSANPLPPAINKDWQSLFNGRDLRNWTAKIYPYEVGINYGNTFRVINNCIQVNYDAYGASFDNRFGHLYYDVPYSHYHIKLEYRFIGDLFPGAPSYTMRNSGIMFHAQDPKTMPANQDWPISVEMQFLGGLGDGVARTTGNMCSPGTHIFHNGSLLETHCINSNSKTYDGDRWVSAELIVLGDSIIHHIIEGDTVLTYSKPHIGGTVVNNYDPRMKIDGKALKRGHIALQSEGQPIEFRKILLKDLSTNTYNN